MTQNRDLLGALALVAALIATASAEFQLARAVGYGEFTAGCVPAALDAYTLRAFSVRRDVPAAVAALVLTNSLAHLVSSGLILPSVPLVIAVSAIAPLVLWRVKALAKPLSGPLAPVQPVSAIPEPEPAPKPVERPAMAPPTAPEPQPAPNSDPLLSSAREFVAEVQRDAGKAPSLRELQAHLNIGQARAQRIRVQIAGGVA